jgi:pyruvate/2-oxoglutarate dehydrogenase complex dihydrolipoamide acyltransferase (E2) component
MKNIVLPELGEGIQTAVLAGWNVNVGDRVREQDDIAELVKDKAVFNVSADCSGTVKELLFKEGDKVNIGETLVVIEP